MFDVYFSKRVDARIFQRISILFSIQIGIMPFKYLGVFVYGKRVSRRVRAKLNGWNSDLLLQTAPKVLLQ